MPRWWNDRITFTLVLIGFVVSLSSHLLGFLPGGLPSLVQFAFAFLWLVIIGGLYWLDRRRPRPRPATTAARPGSAWQRLRADFTTGPLWFRLFIWISLLFAGYLLLSVALIPVDPDPRNAMFRASALVVAFHCLQWLIARAEAAVLPLRSAA